MCVQVFGNAWTWCEDFFSALPGGYGVHAYYDDFSSPCYDGEHCVIMGGSFMSTGDEASRFARFHFRCVLLLGYLVRICLRVLQRRRVVLPAALATCMVAMRKSQCVKETSSRLSTPQVFGGCPFHGGYLLQVLELLGRGHRNSGPSAGISVQFSKDSNSSRRHAGLTSISMHHSI